MELPNGEVLIANGGTNELRFYSAGGEFLRAEGREGQGPGEFEYLRALGRCRESGFVAFDLSWQLNAYDAEGRFIEKTILRAPSGVTPYNLACDLEGRFLILGWGREAQEGPRLGFYQSRDHLVLASAEGEIATDFGERLVSERIGTARGSRPHPAGRATLFALHNERVYVGSGERFEIEVRDLEGKLESLLRGPRIPLETTDLVKTAYLNEVLSSLPPDRGPAIREEVGAWEWPPSLPAYTRLLVDPLGVAWLKAFNISPEKPEQWSLVDPVRGYLGDITLGEGDELLEIGEDHVFLLHTDDLGVESVVRIEVNRGNDS